jgi:hypothetical protein
MSEPAKIKAHVSANEDSIPPSRAAWHCSPARNWLLASVCGPQMTPYRKETGTDTSGEPHSNIHPVTQKAGINSRCGE